MLNLLAFGTEGLNNEQLLNMVKHLSLPPL